MLEVKDGRQLRAARVLLAMSRDALAKRSSLSPVTVTRLEQTPPGQEFSGNIATLTRLLGTLEAEGIRFVSGGVVRERRV